MVPTAPLVACLPLLISIVIVQEQIEISSENLKVGATILHHLKFNKIFAFTPWISVDRKVRVNWIYWLDWSISIKNLWAVLEMSKNLKKSVFRRICEFETLIAARNLKNLLERRAEAKSNLKILQKLMKKYWEDMTCHSHSHGEMKWYRAVKKLIIF